MEETSVMPESTTTSSSLPTTIPTITPKDNDHSNLGGEDEGSSEGSAEDYYADWLSDGDEEYNLDYNYPVGSGNSEPLPILFNEGIDLNVFNVTKLSFQPQAWDAQQAFTSKVLGRLYLVVPGVIVGLILGIALWAVITLVARSLSAVKKKVIPRDNSSVENGKDDNSMEMAAVEEQDFDSPDGIYPAPPSPNLHYEKKDHDGVTAADIESGTTSSGIGKSDSSIPKSDSSSCIASSRESSNGSIS